MRKDKDIERSRHILRYICDKLGVSATKLARRADLSPSTINRFLNSEGVTHNISITTWQKVAEGNKVNMSIILALLAYDGDIPDIPVAVLQDIEGPVPASIMPKGLLPLSGKTPSIDLPVYGEVRGGFDKVFIGKNPSAMVGRPPYLANVDDAYALYMRGTSMEPRYLEGELLFIHPQRPCRPNDYVVLVTEQDEVIAAQFLDKDHDWYTLRKLNPDMKIKQKQSSVRAMHTVVGTSTAW